MSNWNVIPFTRSDGEQREIDFDLYVDLLIIHHGFSRRDAEVEARKECWRDNLKAVRSNGVGGQRP